MAKKFKIDVNSAWCKGCVLCVGICPKSVLEMTERVKATPVKEGDCIGCYLCENICPDLAITIREDKG